MKTSVTINLIARYSGHDLIDTGFALTHLAKQSAFFSFNQVVERVWSEIKENGISPMLDAAVRVVRVKESQS